MDALLEAGAGHDLQLVGQHALGSLRLEKSYPVIQSELHVEATALECGIGRFIDWDKTRFPGREAVLAEHQTGPKRVLCTLVVAVDEGGILGYEGVYADRKVVGHVTSGGYSQNLNSAIALAMLPEEFSGPGAELTVLVLGTHCKASVLAPSPYDPDNLRCRM